MLHYMRFESIADKKRSVWAGNTTSKEMKFRLFMYSTVGLRYVYIIMYDIVLLWQHVYTVYNVLYMEVWMRISKAEQLCLKNLWWDNDRMLIHTHMSCTYKYPCNMNCFYLNTIWQAQEAYSSSTGTLWRETDCIQYVAHDMYMYRETAYARTMYNYVHKIMCVLYIHKDNVIIMMSRIHY